MIGQFKPSPTFFCSIFRNCGTSFNLLARTSASSVTANSSTVGSKTSPVYVPSNGESGRSPKVTGARTKDDKDSRPVIFLWENGQQQQPAEGKTNLINLPACDVVYKGEENEKNPKKRRLRPATKHYYLSDSAVEDTLLKYYLNGKNDLSHNPSVFCVYNAGDSTMPQKLLDANASKVVVLEAPKSAHVTKWQKFAKENAERTIFEKYDFNRLAAGRIRDFHNNKGSDTLWQLFSKAGVASVSNDSQECWKAGINNPPICIMGVADPYKEHALFATLLYSRITRSSIYELGPVEVLAAVTAQQYLDFHPVAAGVKSANIRRSSIPKTVRWRARLYHYLFDIDLVAEADFESFAPEIATKEKLKHGKRSTTRTVYDELLFDTDQMYWVSLRPREQDHLEKLISEDYGDQQDSDTEGQSELDRRRQFPHLAGFAFMHKLLARYPMKTTLGEFLKNYFSGYVPSSVDPEMTVDHGSSAAQMEHLVNMYTEMAKEGGQAFYNSPFYTAAQEFVDGIVSPMGLEPKSGKKKRLV